jgi:hypothetical protein
MLTHKICKGPCKRDLDIDQYHWKSKRRGTRQARCKDCMSDYGHVHYLANSQEYKDRANTRLQALRAENRDLIKSHLLANPCSKCGETNHKVLATNLNSNEINNLATPDLQVRLSECRVLCRNCEASQDLQET